MVTPCKTTLLVKTTACRVNRLLTHQWYQNDGDGSITIRHGWECVHALLLSFPTPVVKTRRSRQRLVHYAFICPRPRLIDWAETVTESFHRVTRPAEGHSAKMLVACVSRKTNWQTAGVMDLTLVRIRDRIIHSMLSCLLYGVQIRGINSMFASLQSKRSNTL